jgi:hypothetical protein
LCTGLSRRLAHNAFPRAKNETYRSLKRLFLLPDRSLIHGFFKKVAAIALIVSLAGKTTHIAYGIAVSIFDRGGAIVYFAYIWFKSIHKLSLEFILFYTADDPFPAFCFLIDFFINAFWYAGSYVPIVAGSAGQKKTGERNPGKSHVFSEYLGSGTF